MRANKVLTDFLFFTAKIPENDDAEMETNTTKPLTENGKVKNVNGKRGFPFKNTEGISKAKANFSNVEKKKFKPDTSNSSATESKSPNKNFAKGGQKQIGNRNVRGNTNKFNKKGGKFFKSRNAPRK